MRVAFVGKGGVGKSAIAGTFARYLARSGAPVLAVDSDPMPGLAFSLGLEVEDTPIPEEAVEERADGETGPRFRLRRDLTAADAVERYSVRGPDGVRFLQLGKIRTDPRAIWHSQFAFRQIMADLPDDHWNVIGDLAGGTRQAFAGWGNYAKTMMIVVEPTAKSTLSARRLARLAETAGTPRVVAVANKVRDDGDADLISRRTGLDVVGAVPWDEALADAERRRRAPIDDAPDSPGVRAVASLVERIKEHQA